MRNALAVLRGSMALGFTAAIVGCSSSGGDSPAGSGGAGGSTQPSCNDVSPCGGDVVGTWNVTSSCLSVSGNWDVTLLGMGCTSVPVTGSLEVKGTWTARANGAYTDETTTTGSMTFKLDAACLEVSSVKVECGKMGGNFTAAGWATAECKTADGQCRCSATANQSGGVAVISPWPSNDGRYTISGDGLNTDEKVDYSYCVSGDTLTLGPKTTILPVKGTVVFQRSAAPGSGGAGGGGTTGAGGTTAGSGGVTTGAAGGTTGAGGKTGAGGTSGQAGGGGGTTTGSGGKTGAGGVTTGASGGASASGGRTGSGGATGGSGGTTSTAGASGTRPCDIYAAANNACVAAHSTVRALFASYDGPLYQVRRASDKTTKDIVVASPGGLADAGSQDSFCSGTTCVILKVYDQTKKGNDIGCQGTDCPNEGKDTPASATNESLNVNGQKVYSLKMKPGNAYWKDASTSGMPTGSAPQGIYMVTSGKYYNSGCCFDYGNGPTTRKMSGGGTMDALYFGSSTSWGSGNGSGPWVMADLEGGIYAGGSSGKNDQVPSISYTYVTAIEKNNGTSEFSLKGGDATTGALSTFYKGKLPNGYSPMKKQGAIILGSGGDCCYSNSNASQGTFYEGAIVSGYPSDATDDAVQANIISTRYGL